MTRPSEAARAAVIALTGKEWREPVRVFHLDHPDLRYRVPGRRRNGVRKSPGERSGAVGAGWSVLLDWPGALGEGLMIMLGMVFSWPFRDVVRGAEGSGAVQFADAFRRGGDWLVWSATRTGLVQLMPDGSQRMWWGATGPLRPQLRLPRRLCWADGSWVRLSPWQSDRERLRQDAAGAHLP